MPDRILAAELDRALDGHGTGLAEAEQLAALLRSAADVARLDVTDAETERALASARARAARPGPRRPIRARLTPRRVLTGAVAAAAIAAAVLVALPESHAPGIDVEGRALAAISKGPPILRAVTQSTTPGNPEKVLRIEWLDPATRREHVQVQIGARVVSETLLETGRVTQYEPQAGRAIVAPSCAALPGGCASLVDPIAFYRRALRERNAGAVRDVTVDGRPAYRFTLPVQALGGGTNLISQQVTVDAKTFLPVSIVWQEAPAGSSRRTVAVIDVVSVSHLGTAEAGDAFTLQLPQATRVVQLGANGAPIGRPQSRPATLAEARLAMPTARWVGRRYQGFVLRRITILRWPSVPAVAIRFDYGAMTLWSFDRVIPGPLLEGTIIPEKLIPAGQGVVRFYVARGGRIVAERDRADVSVAAVGPTIGKLDLLAVVQDAQPL
jgi:hypothetical protein